MVVAGCHVGDPENAMTATKRILVVDDEPNLCLLYETALREDGYEVRCASSAAGALDELDAFHPDLVVMDIRMPGMDGIEAMGWILSRMRDMPVILNTAYCSYKDNFCSWPASAYVVKSSDLSELKEAIRNLLAPVEGRVPLGCRDKHAPSCEATQRREGGHHDGAELRYLR
jgi:DNA-binding response OmpR family regulator